MSRPLYEIAFDIRQSWDHVNYVAVPYLDAMSKLDAISDAYYYDSADSVVRYFLSNATTWKGEKARAIKKELKDMLA